MRISVIPEDRTIVVDGVGRVCKFAAPEGVHAIQWDGATGRVEMKPGYPEAELIEDEAELAPYLNAWTAAEPQPPPPPPPPAITFKTDFWSRCSDEEAELFEQMLAATSAKNRRIFNDAVYLEHSSPLFASLKADLAAATSPERADELLAPSIGSIA